MKGELSSFRLLTSINITELVKDVQHPYDSVRFSTTFKRSSTSSVSNTCCGPVVPRRPRNSSPNAVWARTSEVSEEVGTTKWARSLVWIERPASAPAFCKKLGEKRGFRSAQAPSPAKKAAGETGRSGVRILPGSLRGRRPLQMNMVGESVPQNHYIDSISSECYEE